MKQRNSSNGSRQPFSKQYLNNHNLHMQLKEKAQKPAFAGKSHGLIQVDDLLKSKEIQKQPEDKKSFPDLRKKANTDRGTSLPKPPRHPSAKVGAPKQMLPIDHERQKAKLNNLMASLKNEEEENKDANQQQNNAQPNLKIGNMKLNKKGSLKQIPTSQQSRRTSAGKTKSSVLAVSQPFNQTPKAASIYTQPFSNASNDPQRKSFGKNEKAFNIRNNKVLIRNQSQNNTSKLIPMKNQQNKEQNKLVEPESDTKSKSMKRQEIDEEKDTLSLTQEKLNLGTDSEKKAMSIQKEDLDNKVQSQKSDQKDYIDEEIEKEKEKLLNNSYSSSQSEVLSIRDKYQLFAWGLQLREQIRKRRYFLDVTEELKSRFKRLLYMYQDKRAERNFLELKALIMNFDQGEAKEAKQKLGGKLSRKKGILVMGINPTLQTVEENEEEQNETTFRKNESDHESPLGKGEVREEEERETGNLSEEEIGQFQVESQQQSPKKFDLEKEFLSELLFEEIIGEQTKNETIDLFIDLRKVKSFLQMVIQRRRYLKFKQSMKENKLPKEILQVQEFSSSQESPKYDVSSQSQLPQPDPQKASVSKIEQAFLNYRMRQNGREMRKYLQGLPYECRRSYVKYFDLKSKTSQLKSEVTTYSKKLQV